MDESMKGMIVVPEMQMPPVRLEKLRELKRVNHILIVARGGLGDQVCAEPTLRYITKNYSKENKIYLAAYDGLHELFSHLKFERVFDLREEEPIWDNYFVMETIVDQTRSDHYAHMSDQFFSHCFTNAVDFASICATRTTLPIADKIIQLGSTSLLPDGWLDSIVIHPGRHWQSKTFPASFWEAVIDQIVSSGKIPFIIGADRKDTGTVSLKLTSGAIDLRNKLSLQDSIALIQDARVILTNDSAPLHIAASGKAWIGFIPTIKHPDYITHWRKNEKGTPAWSWRMRRFGQGGLWEKTNNNPGSRNAFSSIETMPPKWVESWLPDPIQFADWACSR